MRFYTIFGISFYSLIFFLLGGAILTLAFSSIALDSVVIFLQQNANNMQMRWVLFGIGISCILISLGFVQVVLGNLQKERTIAFSTSLGQGSVSLSAVEDLIKRISNQLYEIRDIRSDVIATKKGLEVSLRVVLRFETNIPEFTTRLQELVKNKLQEVLGIEEDIIIRTHIAKIISIEEKKRKNEDDSVETHVPFQGYSQT